MKNNLVFVRTGSGGIAPAIAIENSILEKVSKFLSRDVREFHRNPAKCVIPAYDDLQAEPIVKTSQTFGYKTLWIAVLAIITGWHFMYGYPKKTLYKANTEGLRLIAQYGCPHKAYAVLLN